VVTTPDIQKAIQQLEDKWNNPSARNGLFGNILKTVNIKNIRAINTEIDLAFPVTVISGTNGSGKTTVLQICSTAYSKNVGGKYYTLGYWIKTGFTGETPAIQEPAEITFSFWDESPALKFYHSDKRNRWEYPRRKKAERNVEFFKISDFVPRIEKRDKVNTARSKIEIKNSEEIDSNIVQSISRVLSISYEQASEHSVGTSKNTWIEILPTVKRDNIIYSESHMGAGEQKVVRLIQDLEKLPKKSLILLEEPEITLHPDAQRGLAWYLMTLSCRQGHQIIVTTHSPEIFETFPKQARILLLRDKNGVQCLSNVPYLKAARELSSSVKTNKDIILVEDIVAQAFLTEIFQRHDRSLLEQSSIVPVGNTKDVLLMVKSFREQNIRAVGVRDPDIGEDTATGLFSLPGDKAPESLLLDPENIARAEQYVNGIKDAFERSKVQGHGLTGSKWSKKIFEVLPNEAGIGVDQLADRLTLAWFSEPNNNEAAKNVVEKIKSCLEKD
jgi:predicted ATP-dependent endonuclease of OLD family